MRYSCEINEGSVLDIRNYYKQEVGGVFYSVGIFRTSAWELGHLQWPRELTSPRRWGEEPGYEVFAAKGRLSEHQGSYYLLKESQYPKGQDLNCFSIITWENARVWAHRNSSIPLFSPHLYLGPAFCFLHPEPALSETICEQLQLMAHFRWPSFFWEPQNQQLNRLWWLQLLMTVTSTFWYDRNIPFLIIFLTLLAGF